MPAKSAAQYGLMQAVCHGTSNRQVKGLSRETACEFVNKTSSEKRSSFSRSLAKGRRKKKG